jgi:hypothetical protein
LYVIVAGESAPLAAPSIAIALFAHAFDPRFASRVAFTAIAPLRATARVVCATHRRVVVARAAFARATVGRAVIVRIANALIVVLAASGAGCGIAGVDDGAFRRRSRARRRRGRVEVRRRRRRRAGQRYLARA